MAPFLPSTPPASIRSLFSISIFLLNLSFRPVQTVCLCWPLTLSITPAIMRLNLSAPTGHACARARAHAHTRYHPLKKAHYSFSHALNRHKPDAIMQLAHLALLQTLTHTLTHALTLGMCPRRLTLAFPSVSCYQRPMVGLQYPQVYPHR